MFALCCVHISVLSIVEYVEVGDFILKFLTGLTCVSRVSFTESFKLSWLLCCFGFRLFLTTFFLLVGVLT